MSNDLGLHTDGHPRAGRGKRNGIGQSFRDGYDLIDWKKRPEKPDEYANLPEHIVKQLVSDEEKKSV